MISYWSQTKFWGRFRFKEPAATTILTNISSRSAEIIKDLCALFPDDEFLGKRESWVIYRAKAKLSATDDAEIYIDFSDGPAKEYSDFTNVVHNELPAFFYLYHSGEALSPEQKQKVTDCIKGYS